MFLCRKTSVVIVVVAFQYVFIFLIPPLPSSTFLPSFRAIMKRGGLYVHALRFISCNPGACNLTWKALKKFQKKFQNTCSNYSGNIYILNPVFTNGTKYSRIDQIKFVKNRPWKLWKSDSESLNKAYHVYVFCRFYLVHFLIFKPLVTGIHWNLQIYLSVYDLLMGDSQMGD